MSGDQGRGAESIGIHVDAPMQESGRNERGFLVVQRYDRDQTSWLSRQLGGEPAGRPGFVQPQPADFARLGLVPYSETITEHSNLFTTGGWDRMLALSIGSAVQAYDATHTRIGIGTATAAAASGDTSLTATGTASVWSRVTGVGTVGTGTGSRRLSFVSTFGTGDANMAWAEWGIDQGTATGVSTGAATTPLLNHAVSAQGTKASGQTWTATALLDVV